VLRLPEELTHLGANVCLEQLVQALATESAEQVVVDAQALQRFDSSALAVLLDFRRACTRAGKSFAVHGLSDRLQNLATLYGVDGLCCA
jgi:phospholipid transport system transporter-binding protein